MFHANGDPDFAIIPGDDECGFRSRLQFWPYPSGQPAT